MKEMYKLEGGDVEIICYDPWATEGHSERILRIQVWSLSRC